MKRYFEKAINEMLFLVLFCAILTTNALGSPMGVPEHNVDRPGNDIMTGFSSPHWSACSTSCATNNQCRAYTYVNPKSAGQNGTCWLKNKVPAKKANTCCVSGVRIMSPFEEGIDRPWGDLIPGFSVPTRSNCETECTNNSKCKAFTYVKPGYQGPEGKCWLKYKVPAPKTNNCCDSGVKLIFPVRRINLPNNELTPP
ncbi:MAG: PAN domain-containing protein [Deltaproteobacteria bacterium]|nr:PAN domain-containing protein [Deltaproteobacteria bacterium]